MHAQIALQRGDVLALHSRERAGGLQGGINHLQHIFLAAQACAGCRVAHLEQVIVGVEAHTALQRDEVGRCGLIKKHQIAGQIEVGITQAGVDLDGLLHQRKARGSDGLIVAARTGQCVGHQQIHLCIARACAHGSFGLIALAGDILAGAGQQGEHFVAVRNGLVQLDGALAMLQRQFIVPHSQRHEAQRGFHYRLRCGNGSRRLSGAFGGMGNEAVGSLLYVAIEVEVQCIELVANHLIHDDIGRLCAVRRQESIQHLHAGRVARQHHEMHKRPGLRVVAIIVAVLVLQ